ncbi:hypothetical protein CYD30_22495 [Kosakonia cowanii]|nr:hypothetical protein CYD30_22495 [Kosakonia cowanii]
MTKSEFFATMKASRVNASAFITIQGRDGGKTALVMIQADAPNAFLSMHRDGSESFSKAWLQYEKWLKEYFAQASEEVKAQIETDLKAGRPVCEETGADLREWSGNDIEAAHAEALTFNAEVDEVAAANQWDEWANQHDSRKTEAQMIESDHAEALAFNAEYDLAAEMAANHLHQWIFARQRPWVKTLVVEMAHDEALTENATKGTHIEDPARMAAYGSWLARQRVAGRQLIDHACPRCDVVYLTNVPPVGDSYDSFCTCPACGGDFVRIVDNLNGSPVVSVHSIAENRSAAQ